MGRGHPEGKSVPSGSGVLGMMEEDLPLCGLFPSRLSSGFFFPEEFQVSSSLTSIVLLMALDLDRVK